MKETLTRGASMLSIVSTTLFAIIMWWYATQWDHDIPVNYLIMIGTALALLNILALLSLSTIKSTNKKKGKK